MRLRVEHLESLAHFYRGKDGEKGTAARKRFARSDELTEDHFKTYSKEDHICRNSLTLAISLLGTSPSYIVETGSAAWGTKSTLLFDSYVNSFGGKVNSVDIRLEPMFSLTRFVSEKTTIFCDDSISFLRRLERAGNPPNLVYLDSFDLDWADPMPAALHGLSEFLAILPLLIKHGGLLLIDDTPSAPRNYHPDGERLWNMALDRYMVPPGKGSLVNKFITENKLAELLVHDYQVLWRFF